MFSLRPQIQTLFLATALAVVTSAAVALAETPRDLAAPARTLTINATGTVSAKPDVATVNVGVVTQAATANEALSKNNTDMSRLIAALAKAGVAKKDIQTSQFNVSPNYAKAPASSRNSRGEIVGYRVTNQVRIAVRKLERLGTVLDKLSKNGANQMHGISFGFSNPVPLQDKAGVAAIGEAMRKAKLYAGAADVSLGAVLTIEESYNRAPQGMHKMAMMDESSAVPIAVGESQVSVAVTMTFALQ